MDIYISNTSFQLVAVIDTYDSFIWVERYSDYGDFELYLPMDSNVIQYLKANYYVEIRESDRTMIVEDIQIDTDVDNGPQLKISGRSLESILDRRIIWKQTLITNKTADLAIKQLLSENIMSSAGEARCIDGFKYVETYVDHANMPVIPQIQFTGDNLYDSVKSICDAFGLGFKVTGPTSEDRDKGLVCFYFELFQGTNRSYTNDDGTDQLAIPHVIFSPNFDNLLSSCYYESHKNHKTIALIAGQGEGVDRVMVEAPWGNEYQLLLKQPNDWSTSYTSYYTKSNEEYARVRGVAVAPKFEYKTYYISYPKTNNDGVYDSYGYLMLQAEPDDWSTNYSSYFKGLSDGTYAKVVGITIAPSWVRDKYYKRIDIERDSIAKGLSRRELFVDARDLAKESQQTDEDGVTTTVTLSDSEYDQVLVERGNEKLAECAVVESFEGSIDPNESYEYGVDYFIGDVVEVENEYGMSCRCRVTELIRSEDGTGSSAYPTFTKI